MGPPRLYTLGGGPLGCKIYTNILPWGGSKMVVGVEERKGYLDRVEYLK